MHNGGTRPLHNYGGAALVAFNRRTYVSCVTVGERDDDKACLRSGASITQAPKADDSKEAVVALLGVDEFGGCLIGQPKRLAVAVIVSESTIMRWEE